MCVYSSPKTQLLKSCHNVVHNIMKLLTSKYIYTYIYEYIYIYEWIHNIDVPNPMKKSFN